jgi:predicted DNA-binding antitoxin AbrB/MazE fold protein
MLVINGFIENGVFIPNQPIPIQKRMEASLEIKDVSKIEDKKAGSYRTVKEISQKENRSAWEEFEKAIRGITDEDLPDDFPTRIKFRTPEEIEAL